MPVLTIDLQDGFKDDEVVILIAGEENYHKASLTTDYAIGLADSIELRVPEGSVRLTVNIPTRKLVADKQLDVAADLFIGVSVAEKSILFRTSGERFEYF